MQHLVPTDHDFVVLVHDLLQALVEVRLQILVILHPVGMNELLDLRILVPTLTANLVPSDVNVGIGKELRHFS